MSLPPSLSPFMSDFVGYVPVDDESEEDGEESSSPAVIHVPLLPEIYYDSALTTFWVTDNRRSWMRITTGDVKMRLKQKGLRGKAQDGERLSQVDEMVVNIQNGQNIDYAGSLAGWNSGVHEINGKRILVRDSPILIEPEPDEWPMLQEIIDNMLGNQQPYLYGWLKVAIESLRTGNLRVGQTLCFAGTKGCGKSLLQNLITILLGGRSQKSHRYMSGGTQFNEELFGSEHLMLEDEEASTDIRARINLGAKIKEISANTKHSRHPKHRTALTLEPFWRLTISLNDDPEALLILPPMNDGLEDKLIILKAEYHPMPMPTASLEERELFMDALRKELPHFVHFLLLNWEIPESLVSQRFGITHYQHPGIMQALGELSPESQLLQIIDEELFASEFTDEWEGSANKLTRELVKDDSGVSREAKALLKYPTTCGTYLGRLKKLHQDRFECTHTKTGNTWRILRPPPESS
jgi:hypothetical protein